MTIHPISRRRILVGALAVAVVAGPVLIATRPMDAVPLAACKSSEEAVVVSISCAPTELPRLPSELTTTASNPDVPELGGIPCTGRNTGPCLGVERELRELDPPPVSRSTFSASP
jgi:hypothetical protein